MKGNLDWLLLDSVQSHWTHFTIFYSGSVLTLKFIVRTLSDGDVCPCSWWSFCLSDHLPHPHLLPNSQQLLIQTNRMIILQPPTPPFIQLPSPFFHFNKQITNVFTALWTLNFLKPIVFSKRLALKPFIEFHWQCGKVERQAAEGQPNTELLADGKQKLILCV